jgi:hypothetical protein
MGPEPRHRTSAALTGALALATFLLSDFLFMIVRDGTCQDAQPPGTAKEDICHAVNTSGVPVLVLVLPVALVLAAGFAQSNRKVLYGVFAAVVLTLGAGYTVLANA